MEHTGFYEQVDPISKLTYRKCSRCRRVAFAGDDYFNMYCPEAAKDRQQIRDRLEDK